MSTVLDGVLMRAGSWALRVNIGLYNGHMVALPEKRNLSN